MIDIPQDIMADVVSRMLGKVNIDLPIWSVHPIAYPGVSAHSHGLFRVRGSTTTSTGIKDWSLVLKTVHPTNTPSTGDLAQPFYWKREALTYESGLLPRGTDEFAAPTCFGVTEQSDGTLWLWLEAVDEQAHRWTMSRFALAAAHVGTFSGAFSSASALPAAPWLSRGLIRDWVADAADRISCVQNSNIWQHTLLCNPAFPAFVEAILELWEQREGWFTALEQLPQTHCHHDLWRKNLFARNSRAGTEQTVAIDWKMAGLGAVGEDVGNLIGVSLLNFDVEAQDAPVFASATLDHYVHGLQRSGWHGARRVMRAAAQATAALRGAFSTACWPAAIVRNPDTSGQFIQESERRWGRPIETIFAQWASVTAFLLAQADEARTILQP